MPRIGINATFLHDPPTGIAVYSIEVVRRLLKSPDYAVFASLPAMLGPENGDRVLGAFPQFAPDGRTSTHLKRLFWAQVSLPRLARKHGLGLIYSTSVESSLVASPPHAITIYDVAQLAVPELLSKRQGYFRHVVPRMARRARAVITISEFSKGEIAHHCGVPPERIHVAACAVNRGHFHPRPPGDPRARHGRYVLMVGGARPHKNIPRGVRAFDRLHDDDLKLVIIGPRDAVEFGEAMNGVRRPERIVFPGRVGTKELAQYYADAAAFLFPSLYEGFGLPPLEAMACGTPVAAARAASLPEVCGDAARLFDPLSEEDMAAALREVLDAPGRFRERGLARAEAFSWDRTAETIDRVLRALSND
jgi:glycosyltransferase involved in cell wall biosynthesis